MVLRTTLYIQPTNLTDLTITNEDTGDSLSLSDFSIVGDYLEGEISSIESTSIITIESTGYSTVSSAFSDLDSNPYVILEAIPDYVTNLSDGTNNYVIEAKAVEDNNGNAIKTWVGTKAQYDAIVTKDSDTLYNITDDVINNNILDVHTNYARIGELLICWGTTSSKQIVVNSSKSATWNVSFPQGVSFADTSYEATATQGANVGYFANVNHVVQNKSTSGFDIFAYSQAPAGTTSGNIIYRWIAIGKGA